MSVSEVFGVPVPARPALPRDVNLLRHQRNLRHLIALHEANGARELHVDGFSILTTRGVFNPAFGSFSRALGGVVADRVGAGQTVLDLGTGSGYLALCAAARGASVVAVDANVALEPLVLHNAARNGAKVEFRAGRRELFGGMGSAERFDVITANLPFSRDVLVRAWRHTEYYQSFAAPAGLITSLVEGALRHLNRGGQLLFCYGSSGWMDELEHVLGSISAARVEIVSMDQTPTLSEWRFIFAVRSLS